MQAKTKEKIQNILSRSFASLPVANDLPRLAKHIRIYDGETLLFPSKIETFTSTVDYLYWLFIVVTRMVCPEEETHVEQVFDQCFKRRKAGNVNSSSPSEGSTTSNAPSSSTEADELAGLQDQKLKEALRFLPKAFLSSTSSAAFLFNLDKPTSKVTVFITPKGVKVKEGAPTDGTTVDCTISCSSAVLTSILSGSTEAKAALQAGQLIVDNLPKLMVFGQVFQFDAKAFQAHRAEAPSPSAGNENDNAILSISTKKFFEALGETHRLVLLLKACNSATMAPAIIELKFALGTQNMTKDVPDTWKFEILFNDTGIFLKTRKSEQDLKGMFLYDWELQLRYNSETLQCEDLALHVLSIKFTESSSSETKTQIKQILDTYGPPPVISRKSSLGRNKSLDSVVPPPQERGHNWKKETYTNGDEYEGEFNEDGKRHGKGTYSTPSGDLYVGTYKNGLRHGKGVYTMKDGTRYEGEFKDGRPSGKGTYVFSNGDIYMGEFDDDEFHGEGSWSSPDGSSYQGNFRYGKRHGRGLFFSKGVLYDGEWQNGVFNGFGFYFYTNGDSFEGEFKNGKFNGYGRYTTASKVIVEGLFVDGKPHLTGDKLREADRGQKEKFEAWRRDQQPIYEQRKKLHQQKLQLKAL